MTLSLDKSVAGPTFHPVGTRRRVVNSSASVIFTAAFVLALVPLVWVLWTVVGNGIGAVTSSTWWGQSQSGVLPKEEAGGAYHAIMGSVMMTAVAAVVSIPLGLFAGVYLVEYGTGKIARFATFAVDILAGVPSIVAGLFIFSLWISILGFPRSAFAVSLALILLMLPVVIRNTEEMLKLVPDELREASYALGIPKWKTILRIVLPTALSGIINGILLGIARVIGETAPMLILLGYAAGINNNPFEGNMGALPLMIKQELLNPSAAGEARMWGAALTLILIVGVLIAAASILSRLVAPKTK